MEGYNHIATYCRDFELYHKDLVQCPTTQSYWEVARIVYPWLTLQAQDTREIKTLCIAGKNSKVTNELVGWGVWRRK